MLSSCAVAIAVVHVSITGCRSHYRKQSVQQGARPEVEVVSGEPPQRLEGSRRCVRGEELKKERERRKEKAKEKEKKVERIVLI